MIPVQGAATPRNSARKGDSGNTEISEIWMTGTHQGELMKIPPTGKRIDLVGCNVVELRDGKVYREREYFDALEMWMQLGVLAPPVPR